MPYNHTPMELPELLHRIEELQARIEAAGPLSTEAKRKLDYRFRLDWNYHSNVMEGSSLTKQETRTIMLGSVTVSGKPIKDVLEMTGHDQVITELLKMAKGELNLSEARIKAVHRAIVREDHPDRQQWVGQWKKDPNYLHNYRGERFDFTPPEDVPQAIHELLDRTKAAMEKIERNDRSATHPALLAFDFHREYVTIHPFHDGNGRTARIFSNLLLMRFGYPPVVIKVEEKDEYNRLLAEVQAYGAPPDLFNAFLAERLIHAEEIVIDAIEGKDLAEDDDIVKRADLLFIQAEGRRLTETERVEHHNKMILNWIELNHPTLIERIQNAFDPFARFFKISDYRYLMQKKDGKGVAMPTFKGVGVDAILQHQKEHPRSQIGMTITFIGFKYDPAIKEKKVVLAVRFMDDEVLLHWYPLKMDDQFSYAELVKDSDMPVMRKMAEKTLADIEKLISKSQKLL